MTWTEPRTWVAGETATAALLNTHVRDNLLDFGDDWTTWTPTTTGFTATATMARYKQSSKTVELQAFLTLTSAVTATMQVTVPVTEHSSYPAMTCVGNASCFDLSANSGANAVAILDGTNSRLSFRILNGGALMANTVPVTWAAGDVLRLYAIYEAA